MFTLPAHLAADVREVWFRADDLRLYTQHPQHWAQYELLHAVCVDMIVVAPNRWRQGICKRFVESLRDDARFELAVVGMVQNPHLWDALARWGWACNRRLQDFYWPHSEAAKAAVLRATS